MALRVVASSAVVIGAGSEFCPKELAEGGKFEEIAARAYDFLEAGWLARAER